MQKIDFWAITHQGLKRTNNEDAYLWLTPSDTNDQGYLWVVCDGMGGEAAGERAAEIVLERIREVYSPALASTGSPHAALKETLNAANRRLLYVCEEQPELAGMGSTVAAVALYEDRLWVASVGDSRVYGWTPQGLMQWTVDHSKYETLREHGVLRPEDERDDHPARSVLMNVVGREKMYVDTLDDRHFSPEDSALLLCSDGLSGHIRPKELRVAFASLDAQDAARFLMSAVLQRSTDNITLQVVRFRPPVSPRPIEEVASSLGVTLLDGARDRHWKASGQRHDAAAQEGAAQDAAKSPSEASTDLAPGVPHKPVTQGVVLPPSSSASGASGRTVLLSPDALSNVFGDAPKGADDVADEITQRRLQAKGGTVLLSPDELSKAEAMLAAQTTPEKSQDEAPEKSQKEPAERDAESSAKPSPIASPVPITSAPIETLDPPRYTTLSTSTTSEPPPPEAASPPREEAPRRHLTVPPSGEAHDAYAAIVDEDDVPPPPRRRAWLWAVVALLVLLIAAGLWWVVQHDAQDAESNDASEAAASDHDAAAAGDEANARSLPEFQHAREVSAPEMMHEIDNMPSYRVADGAWWLDAHEVTEAQFARVRETFSDDENVQVLLQTLPCFGSEDLDDSAHENHPACVSPIAAEAYCVAVGRRLPTEAAWEEIVASDDARIARGYDQLFERVQDGPPPAYPAEPSSILGVYDGLPEVLSVNDTQRRYGDLVLLAPHDEGLTRTDAGAANAFEDTSKSPTQMLGVRCMMHASDLEGADDAEVSDATENSSSRTRSTRQAKDASAGASSSTSKSSVQDAGNGREAGGIDPRVEAPDEAPMDPDIPDRSRILEYMKEQQSR